MEHQIQDILNIVKYTYNIPLDEKSLNYERFITHLRFFFQRLSKNLQTEEEDDFLLKQVKTKYKKAYDCMLKIDNKILAHNLCFFINKLLNIKMNPAKIKQLLFG